jgi:hypothetical protein
VLPSDCDGVECRKTFVLYRRRGDQKVNKEHRFDWEYLKVSTNLSRCCPYIQNTLFIGMDLTRSLR